MLILAGEVVFAYGRADAIQRFEGFALGVKRFAGQPNERLSTEGRLDDELFVDLGDRGKRDDLPALPPKRNAAPIADVRKRSTRAAGRLNEQLRVQFFLFGGRPRDRP